MNFDRALKNIRSRFSSKTKDVESENPLKYNVLTTDGRKSLKFKIDLLFKSIELINTSKDLDIVLHRYDMVCSLLEMMTVYTYDELKIAGFPLQESLSENTLSVIYKNKANIINKAIERNIRYDINQLPTTNRKMIKLDSLYSQLKRHEKLEKENIAFLKTIYHDIKNEIIASEASSGTASINAANTAKILVTTPSFYTVSINEHNFNPHPEISDLLWFGDGIHKNYTPPQNEEPQGNTFVIIATSHSCNEPSTIYEALPVSRPAPDALVESPPYYPSYSNLSPEQRWMYWKFLSDPFSPENDIGYAFLFYYGLERHMLLGNLDKAFRVTLKLRSCYINSSFHLYTSNALFLICKTKKRDDLALKFIESSNHDDSTISLDYLLLLKYQFDMPLTVSEIIKNHRYFDFCNNRYIKNEPELFTKVLSELCIQNFQTDSINLNQYFPIDINSLQLEQKEIFINSSLSGYKASAQIFKNPKLMKKISFLLNETHETVKNNLRYGKNADSQDIYYIRKPKKSFKNMTGYEFEKYCAHLLSKNQFSSVSVTKDSGDQGIDIIAYKNNVKYGIQCKLYSSHVGNSAVQQAYSGKDFYKCQIGVVLTNNEFTDSAIELANALGIILWNGNDLFQLEQGTLQ